MVDKRLEELGMSKAELARKLGYVGYQGYHDLFVSKRIALTPEKLRDVAEALKWPRDHFEHPDKTPEREEYVRREFDKYLATEVGQTANPETHRILQSMQWLGEYLPSVRLYQVLTLVMEARYPDAQILGALALEEQDRLPQTEPAKTKPETKRPPPETPPPRR